MTMNFGQHDSHSRRHDFGRDDFRATWPVTGIGPLSVELAVKGLKLFSKWIIRFHLNLVWGGKLLTSAVIVFPSPCDVMYIFNSPYLKYIWNKSKPIASACTIAGKERDIQLVVAPLSRQTLFATGSSTSQIFWKEYNSLLKLLSIFLPSYEPSIWFFLVCQSFSYLYFPAGLFVVLMFHFYSRFHRCVVLYGYFYLLRIQTKRDTYLLFVIPGSSCLKGG